MEIAREKLIKFYDERVGDSGRGSDVAALTGLWGEDLLFGILQHYWRNVDGAESEILSYSCGTGKQSGPRLDGWLLKRASGEKRLYQIEVKNWAAHSLGERQLGLSASDDEIRRYCAEQWQYYFGGDTIPAATVAKVLAEMQRPRGYENCRVTPLLCFWFFIAESVESPFSRRRYADGREVHVFSASCYLRSLRCEYIDLSMPRAARRLNLLSELMKKEA